MRITLLSDAHLHGLEDPAQHALVGFLERWETDRLVLCGDVFDVWWGWERAVYSAYLPVLAALHALGRRGVAISFVPGNHDFRLGATLAAELGIEVATPWWAVHRGRRICAVHGDEVDRSLGTRLLRRFLRGSGARVGMRLLGPDLGWRASRALSGSSRMHGDTAPSAALRDAQLRLADSLCEEGAEVVFMGHTHAPEIAPRPGGTFVNLGDWALRRSFAVLDDDLRLLRWTGERAEPLGSGG